MAGFVIERHGYTTAAGLIGDVVTDMLANGFTFVWTTGGGNTFNKTSAGAKFNIIMEAGGDVDPLNASSVVEKQPWRVAFQVTNSQQCFMQVATPLQLTNDGAINMDRNVSQGGDVYYLDWSGNVGAQIGNTQQDDASLRNTGIYTNQLDADETKKGIINRPRRITGSKDGNATTPGANGAAAYPMSYRLVITNRGFWLGIWEDAITAEAATAFNWVLVQRPVDRTTGATLTTGKAPVFCVNGVGNAFWQFVVRESDILRPGARRSASLNSADSEAVLNIENQVSLSEDGKYIVTFPSRLNTSRYRYPHELDIIGITSSDVVSQYSDVPLTVYGESSARSYKALHASGTTNTGMRILVLQQGGGVS